MYACKYICNIAGCSTIAQSFTSNIFPLYKILHVGIYQKFLKNAFNFISNIYDKCMKYLSNENGKLLPRCKRLR